jgi:hypothetical protein
MIKEHTGSFGEELEVLSFPKISLKVAEMEFSQVARGLGHSFSIDEKWKLLNWIDLWGQGVEIISHLQKVPPSI